MPSIPGSPFPWVTAISALVPCAALGPGSTVAMLVAQEFGSAMLGVTKISGNCLAAPRKMHDARLQVFCSDGGIAPPLSRYDLGEAFSFFDLFLVGKGRRR